MKNTMYIIALGMVVVATGINAATIDISTLIQEAKSLAERVEIPDDVNNVIEQVMNEVPNRVLAYVPSAVATGRVIDDIKKIFEQRCNVTLSKEEIASLERGVIPTRVRVIIQTAIPDMVQAISTVESFLKNIDTALYLLNNVIVPETRKYLNQDLQNAVDSGVAYAYANKKDIQNIANQLLNVTGPLKGAINSLKGLNDTQFKGKLVQMLDSIRQQALPIFNGTIKPFIMNNRQDVYNRLMKFKGIRFTESDMQKVKKAIEDLAQL